MNKALNKLPKFPSHETNLEFVHVQNTVILRINDICAMLLLRSNLITALADL